MYSEMVEKLNEFFCICLHWGKLGNISAWEWVFEEMSQAEAMKLLGDEAVRTMGQINKLWY